MGLEAAVLSLIVICLVLGACAYIADGRKKPENIADAQTTSERGLW